MRILDELTSFFEGEPQQEAFIEDDPVRERGTAVLFDYVVYGIRQLTEKYQLDVPEETEAQPAEVIELAEHRQIKETAANKAPIIQQPAAFISENERDRAIEAAEAAVRAAQAGTINPLIGADYDSSKAA